MTKKAGKKEEQSSFSLLTDFDIHLFKTGKHFRLYEKMGAHAASHDGKIGTFFAVWAPNATEVSLIGNFNHWQKGSYKLHPRWDESGIWEGFFTGIHKGEAYKYSITSHSGEILEKADPFAFYAEVPPKTASVVWEPSHTWTDQEWQQKKRNQADKPQPFSVYEMHFGRRQSIAHVFGNEDRAGPIHQRSWIYSRRVPSADGTSILWIVGLPVNRLFRALQSLRSTRTIDGPG